MITFVLQFILWFVVWSCLTGLSSIGTAVLGVLASLFVTFMTIELFLDAKGSVSSSSRRRITVLGYGKRFAWFLYYVMVFILGCLRANVDVAYRVIHPSLPIRPGTVKVKTGLTSDIALTFLASSVTLTPGTTTVDIDKQNGYIYIHQLYMKPPDAARAGKMEVVERFEKILARIFE